VATISGLADPAAPPLKNPGPAPYFGRSGRRWRVQRGRRKGAEIAWHISLTPGRNCNHGRPVRDSTSPRVGFQSATWGQNYMGSKKISRFDHAGANDGLRRISPVAAHSGDRLLSEPISRHSALSAGTALHAPEPTCAMAAISVKSGRVGKWRGGGRPGLPHRWCRATFLTAIRRTANFTCQACAWRRTRRHEPGRPPHRGPNPLTFWPIFGGIRAGFRGRRKPHDP
jgi:hypothetical protein